MTHIRYWTEKIRDNIKIINKYDYGRGHRVNKSHHEVITDIELIN